MIELKPCPFCGSDNVFLIDIAYGGGITHLVKCANCETYGPRWNKSDEEGIKAWNKRPQEAPDYPEYDPVSLFLQGYNRGMNDSSDLLRPFLKEEVIKNDGSV